MATEQQYAVFKALYDEEAERYRDLSDRAKTYISVITIFSGVLVFKSDDLQKFLNGGLLARWSFVAGAVLFICALGALLAATRIRGYVRFADPDVIIDKWPKKALGDEEFFTDRIGELAISTNANATCNNDLAKWLAVSSWLLIAAVAAMMLSLIGRVVK